MFCPKCSYQPTSDTVRFCPGCGFRLDGIATLIASNGEFAAEEPARPRKRPSMVKRGAMLGVTLMLIFNVFFALLIPGGRGESLALGSMATWAGLMVLINLSGPALRLFKKLFSETDPPENPSISSKKVSASPVSPSLPPVQSTPVYYEPPQRVTTSRLAARPSVTEQTTGLLNKE
jgi:hypothetical protein